MDEGALQRARQRLSEAASGRPEPAVVEAALDRAHAGLEALARTAAELESSLPPRIEGAVQDGLRAQVLPVARHLAEVRGLMSQVIGRLERIEGDLLAERHARIDDLALLVDLVSTGWKGVDTRLTQLEGTRARKDEAPAFGSRTAA